MAAMVPFVFLMIVMATFVTQEARAICPPCPAPPVHACCGSTTLIQYIFSKFNLYSSTNWWRLIWWLYSMIFHTHVRWRHGNLLPGRFGNFPSFTKTFSICWQTMAIFPLLQIQIFPRQARPVAFHPTRQRDHTVLPLLKIALMFKVWQRLTSSTFKPLIFSIKTKTCNLLFFFVTINEPNIGKVLFQPVSFHKPSTHYVPQKQLIWGPIDTKDNWSQWNWSF